MTIAKSRLFFLISLTIVAAVSTAWADSMVSLMGYPYGATAGPGFAYATQPYKESNPITTRITALVYPVLGFPEIVQTGDELKAVVYYPHGDDYADPQDWQVRLTTGFANPADSYARVGDPVAQNYDLVISNITYDATNQLYVLTCPVPDGIPEDIFGLAIVAETIADYQPAAVAIKEQIGSSFVFGHLTDIQLDDLGGASTANEDNNHSYPGAATEARTTALFQNEIWRELALLRPDFVVIGGNLTYGTSFNAQNDFVAKILENTKTPLFMAPGNHDGYAYFAGANVGDDGLEHYARDFGPLYYSFDYGPLHFAVANSYDGSTLRREALDLLIFGSPANNSGGFFSQEQYIWLQSDLAAAVKAGRSSLLFMHHDPRGPYFADVPPPPKIVLNGPEQLWNFDSSAWDSNPNDNIANETAQNNTGVKLLETALLYDVSHVFIGHSHWDNVWQFKAGDKLLDRDDAQVGSLTVTRPFAVVQTTTASAGVQAKTGKTEYNGYRLIEVQNGAVTQTNALDPAQPSRSVPAGNFWFDAVNNEGQSTYAQIQVVNGLPLELSVTLQFFMAGLPQGYRVVNEETGEPVAIVDVGLGENGGAVLYAKAQAPGTTTFPVAPGAETVTRFAAEPNPTNKPPVAAFVVTPTSDDRTVHFDASSTTDPAHAALRYFWDFGDGLTGVGKVIDHVYPRGGSLTVTLTAMDPYGGVGTMQTTLGVANCCPDHKHHSDKLACGQCDLAPAASPWPSLVTLLLAALGVALLRFALAQRRGK